MVPSVEIYDPRRGSWVMVEPMNQSRGHFAAGVLNESIYVMGGVQTNDEIVGMVCLLFSQQSALSLCFFDATMPTLSLFVLTGSLSLSLSKHCFDDRLSVTRKVKVGRQQS